MAEYGSLLSTIGPILSATVAGLSEEEMHAILNLIELRSSDWCWRCKTFSGSSGAAVERAEGKGKSADFWM